MRSALRSVVDFGKLLLRSPISAIPGPWLLVGDTGVTIELVSKHLNLTCQAMQSGVKDSPWGSPAETWLFEVPICFLGRVLERTPGNGVI
jgi:hypothetical protein